MDMDESPPSPTLSVKSSGLPFTIQDVNSDYTPQSTKVGVLYFRINLSDSNRNKNQCLKLLTFCCWLILLPCQGLCDILYL